MTALLILLVAVLGLAVGSFLNVLTIRLISGSKIVMGRSQCQVCGTLIKVRDLIPLLSYLLLLGKCRDCEAPISWQYPLVEFTTSVLFVLMAIVHLMLPEFNVWLLVRDLVFTSALVSLFVFDYRWFVLPDQVTIPLIIVAIAANMWLGVSAVSMLVGAIVGGGLYFALWAISRGTWVGSGDIRLGMAMGFMLGWPGVIIALYISYLLGGVIAIVLLTMGKKGRGSMLPMGTFLTVGTYTTLLVTLAYPDLITLLFR